MHPREATNPFQFTRALADQAEALMPPRAPVLTYEVHDRGDPDYNGYSLYSVYRSTRGWYWQPHDGDGEVGFAVGPFKSAGDAERAGRLA
jgi:hypothetical protein